jgi:hypothetical protein
MNPERALREIARVSKRNATGFVFGSQRRLPDPSVRILFGHTTDSRCVRRPGRFMLGGSYSRPQGCLLLIIGKISTCCPFHGLRRVIGFGGLYGPLKLWLCRFGPFPGNIRSIFGASSPK